MLYSIDVGVSTSKNILRIGNKLQEEAVSAHAILVKSRNNIYLYIELRYTKVVRQIRIEDAAN